MLGWYTSEFLLMESALSHGKVNLACRSFMHSTDVAAGLYSTAESSQMCERI
jgi:hypothetical protein